MRYAVTDTEWRLIRPTLFCKPQCVPRVDGLRVLNGMVCALRPA